MNVETGELNLVTEEEMKEAIKKGFTSVPKEHQEEAAKELGDKKSVMVDMNKKSPLVNWAKEQKKRIEETKRKTLRAEKRKRVAKIAKASKRRNRK
jgi:cytosine/adenosine deaminase-related metal-dependent hydrolase